MLPDRRSPKTVLEQAPEAVLAWVRQHLPCIDCDEGWEIIAYGCDLEVSLSSELTDDEILALSMSSILIHERLWEICPNSPNRYSFIGSAMGTRASLIQQFGPRAGDPFRDPAYLEDWFFRRLSLSYDAAAAMLNNLPNLPINEILRIYTLMDRLRLLKKMQPQEMFRRAEELNRWYALLDLPEA